MLTFFLAHVALAAQKYVRSTTEWKYWLGTAVCLKSDVAPSNRSSTSRGRMIRTDFSYANDKAKNNANANFGPKNRLSYSSSLSQLMLRIPCVYFYVRVYAHMWVCFICLYASFVRLYVCIKMWFCIYVCVSECMRVCCGCKCVHAYAGNLLLKA